MVKELDHVGVREVIWWRDRQGDEHLANDVLVGAEGWSEVVTWGPLILWEGSDEHVIVYQRGDFPHIIHVDALSRPSG
jgi:hypothetical protein